MTESKQRRTAEDGSKYYEHPTRTALDGTVQRYTSVTTALGVVAKPALIYWATGLAARRAMQNLPRLIGAARVEECGRTRKRTGPPRCGTCVECVAWWVEGFHIGEKERRAREGSAVHDVIEWWSKTGVIRHDPSAHLYEYDGVTRQVTLEQIQPYIDSFLQWIADYGITPESFLACEATVWHHTDLWAGTTDGILLIRPVTAKAAKLCARINAFNGRTGTALLDPVVVVLDNKSREKVDKAFYPEYALQGAAYRHAETMTAKQGVIEMEMPPTDGVVIFQPRPGGYSFEPITAGKREYLAFLRALHLYQWRADHGDASVQVGTFPVPEEWQWQPPVVAGVEAPKPVKSAKKAVAAKKATPVKKAVPTKKTAAVPVPPGVGSTLESMRQHQRVIGAEISDDQIPF